MDAVLNKKGGKGTVGLHLQFYKNSQLLQTKSQDTPCDLPPHPLNAPHSNSPLIQGLLPILDFPTAYCVSKRFYGT